MVISNIRNKTKGIVLYFIVGLIVIPFALVGLGDLSGSFENVIKVGEIEISKTAISRTVKDKKRLIENNKEFTKKDYIKAVSSSLGYEQELSEDEFWEIIESRTKAELVNQALIENLIKDNMMTVSDEEVRNSIYKNKIFWVGDAFDNKKYSELLKNNGVTAGQYEKSIFKTLSNTKAIKILSSYIGNSVSDELNNKYLNGVVEISYVDVATILEEDASEFKANEVDIQSHYDINLGRAVENGKKYYTEKTINVALVEIPKNYVRDGIVASEDELMALYNDYKFNISKFKSWDIKHRVYESEIEANNGIKILDSNDNMEGVVVGDLMPEIDVFLNKSSEGDTTTLKTEFGWHAINVLKINKKIADTYESKILELKLQFKDSMESIEVAKMMDDLDGLLYDSGLDAVSKDTGIKKNIVSITKESKYAQANDSMIWESAKIGDNNRIMIGKKDVFWEIMEINEAKEKMIGEVRSEIIIELKGINRVNKMYEVAKKLQEDGYSGEWETIDIPREFRGKERQSLSADIFNKNLNDVVSIHIFSKGNDVIAYKINGLSNLDKPLWSKQAIIDLISQEKISISIDRLKGKYEIVDEIK